MDIIGLIPARGGSKGVPRKNVKLLGGRPLLHWSVDTALQVKGLKRVIVSTEDEEIADVSLAAGAEVPFMRPKSLASDGAKSLDVVNHVLDELAEREEYYDAVCLIQPTAPFRSVGLLQRAIDLFNQGDYTGVISVEQVPHHYHPNWAFVANSDGQLIPAQGQGSVIPRRQDLPPAYIRDGAVYITRAEVLRAGSFFGGKLGYVINQDSRRVNIDTEADWAAAEEELRQ